MSMRTRCIAKSMNLESELWWRCRPHARLLCRWSVESQIYCASYGAAVKPSVSIDTEGQAVELLEVAWPLDGLEHGQQAYRQSARSSVCSVAARTRNAHRVRLLCARQEFWRRFTGRCQTSLLLSLPLISRLAPVKGAACHAES